MAQADAAPARPPSSRKLEQEESLARTSPAVFRSRFLLDPAMAKDDLNAMVDQAKRLLREIEEITRRLSATVSAFDISGAWKDNGGGIFAIRQAGTTEEPVVLSGPHVVDIVSAYELRKIAGYAGVTSAWFFGTTIWRE